MRSAGVRVAAWGAIATALIFATACGPGHSVLRTSTPEATAAPQTLTVENQTPCIIHVRFDNGFDSGRVPPGETKQFADPRLPEYRFLQVESTMAIFHTYDMTPIREAGYSLTVLPSTDDDPCVEQPPS